MSRVVLAVSWIALACTPSSPPAGSSAVATPGSSSGAPCAQRDAGAPCAQRDADGPSPQLDAGGPSSGTSSSGAFAQLDPDGDDDPPETTPGPLPSSFHFERVGRAPLALQRICDLTPFGDALYATHANQPLGTDGATVTTYRPDDTKHPFAVAFDWNRPGEPTRGGGGGQGFLRVHAIGGRLFVPDTDPPYAGFGIADHGTEGYVFFSDERGVFAPARMPGHLPPSVRASLDGGAVGAGAGVVPRAYHVLDVIRFRGRYYASTGSVPPTERAWHGASPGALHVAEEGEAWARWRYEVDYPWPWQEGVWRLTYLVRYRDSLYAGIADYDGRDPNDFVIFSPAPDATTILHESERFVRITRAGAALTLRWYADAGRLWWIALEHDGDVVLRVTGDGHNWSEVPLPADAGRPTDITRFKDALVALTEQGLWRVDVDPPVELARVREKNSPFAITDAFCAAPIVVFRGALYAGSQRDGSLWRVAEGPGP
jgi:hypothetical protein